MKHAFAIALLSIPTTLSAGDRCVKFHSNHTEVARSVSARPVASRVAVVRTQKAAPLLAWQRALLFEPQIL